MSTKSDKPDDKLLKSEDSGMHPKSDYAYTPSDNVSDWKLKLTATPGGDPDPAIVGMAAAALGKGFRGKTAEIPDADRAGVVAKVRAAWKKANPDKNEDEMPDAIKAAEMDGMKECESCGKNKPLSDFDNGQDICQECEKSRQADEPGAEDLHVPGIVKTKKTDKASSQDAPAADDETDKQDPKKQAARLNYLERLVSKMREVIGGKGYGDAEDLKAMQRHARGHAGGLAKASATKTAGEPDISQYDLDNWGDDVADADVDDDALDETQRPKKTKADAKYRPAKSIDEQCEHCYFFMGDITACALVEGRIDAEGTCDLFQSAGDVQAKEPIKFIKEPIRAAEFIEPPNWIPYLPKPGKYAHPVHGEMDITPERIDRFIENFNGHVYQDRIPIDAEHQTKLSGAYGWGDQMRKNEYGGADLHVDWTQRGRVALGNNQFLFFSPEWFEDWENPAEPGKSYRDVAIGGALTTRPFFKPDALRPLAASGNNRIIYLDDAVIHDAEEPVSTVQMSDEVSRKFAELEQKIGQLRSENDNLRQSNEAQGEQVKALADKNKQMEQLQRHQRFTEMAKGWSDIGNEVMFLEALAEKFGEDSDQFKGHVSRQTKLMRQLKQSNLYQPIGSDGFSGGASVTENVGKMASQRASEKHIDMADALSQIFSERPDLYEEYYKEARSNSARAGKAE